LGPRDGPPVGATMAVAAEGDRVGGRVGAEIGAVVGTAIGDCDGRDVGVALGALVGDPLGDDVGSEVGTALGVVVGYAVGKAVGARVGAHEPVKQRHMVTPGEYMAKGHPLFSKVVRGLPSNCVVEGIDTDVRLYVSAKDHMLKSLTEGGMLTATIETTLWKAHSPMDVTVFGMETVLTS
jgi:hypothetical protein